MNKFGLFEFFSKLSANKEAQNSLNAILKNILPNLLGGNNGDKINDESANENHLTNSENNKFSKPDLKGNEKTNSNAKNNNKVNFNDNVYASPVNESLYKELIKRHDDISKKVLKNDNNSKNS